MSNKPRGAEQVKTALVGAAVELLGQRPPNLISGRDLADLAKVNYGLIHRYFGSKEVLLQTGLAELAASFAKGAPDGSWSSVEPFSIRHRQDYLRALAFSSLSGEIEELSTVNPVVEKSLEKINNLRGSTAEPSDEIRTSVAVGTLFQLGWSLFEQRVLPGFSFNKEESEEFDRRLRLTLRAIMLDGDIAQATKGVP
ncbi:MAG: TetR/AcrR family transcriptional regulator, partial [Acidimicrobiales bacterium]|nr:TetR/AcrR family transcriptional regulator [Acidimicrobiales bacterium]